MKPKRRLRGQGQGHWGELFYVHVKVLSQGMRVASILREKSLATFVLPNFNFCRIISLLLAGIQPCKFLDNILMTAKGPNKDTLI